MPHEIVPAVPSHATVDEMAAALSTKGTPEAQGMYPTDGTADIVELERRIGVLEDMEQRQVVAYHAGMRAVIDAVEVSLYLASQRGQQPKIAKPEQSYSQTDVFVTKYLTKRGVQICCYDSGDPEDVEYVLEEDKPQVFLSETVSNGPNMPVLDHEHLLGTVRATDDGHRPIVILDNTLPLSSGLPVGELLTEEDEVIVVNSGMKMISMNSEMLGFSYSKNEALLQELRDYRVTARTIPSVMAARHILEMLPGLDTPEAQQAGKQAFDERNRRIFSNSKKVAEIAFRAEQDGAGFQVKHPNVGDHPSREYVEGYFNNGIVPAPIFYLHCQQEGLRHIELARRLFDWSPEVREHAKLRQSFGFDDVSVLFSAEAPVFRIAPGPETQVEAFGEALYKAALAK